MCRRQGWSLRGQSRHCRVSIVDTDNIHSRRSACSHAPAGAFAACAAMAHVGPAQRSPQTTGHDKLDAIAWGTRTSGRVALGNGTAARLNVGGKEAAHVGLATHVVAVLLHAELLEERHGGRGVRLGLILEDATRIGVDLRELGTLLSLYHLKLLLKKLLASWQLSRVDDLLLLDSLVHAPGVDPLVLGGGGCLAAPLLLLLLLLLRLLLLHGLGDGELVSLHDATVHELHDGLALKLVARLSIRVRVGARALALVDSEVAKVEVLRPLLRVLNKRRRRVLCGLGLRRYGLLDTVLLLLLMLLLLTVLLPLGSTGAAESLVKETATVLETRDGRTWLNVDHWAVRVGGDGADTGHAGEVFERRVCWGKEAVTKLASTMGTICASVAARTSAAWCATRGLGDHLRDNGREGRGRGRVGDDQRWWRLGL